jgi:hypothetical protein
VQEQKKMSVKDFVQSPRDTVTALIASGETLSDTLNLGGLRLFGIVMPEAWTSASLTFQASFDGGATWHDLKDSDGNEITVTASAGDCVVWLPSAFAAIPILKIRSGLSAAPIVQAADRTITLILRSI